MILVNELIEGMNFQIFGNLQNVYIHSLRLDSRKIQPDDAFIALRGVKLDGHQYIENAIERGATVIFVEKIPDKLHDKICYIELNHGRKDVALLASGFYGNPSTRLTLVGVTGTNGKTTVATLLYRLFSHLGHKCGLISTIENRIGDAIVPATHTTPDALSLQALLRRMEDVKCTHVFMEVSSHAIDQYRTYATFFTGRIFTNITHDHLDYHGDFRSYLNAKKKFFDHAEKDSIAIINIDDKNGKIIMQNTAATIRTYGLRSLADYRAKIMNNDFSGLQLLLDNHEVHFRLIGRFNAYNLLAVYAMAVELGEDEIELLTVMSQLQSADGRFDVLMSESKVTAIVDYAHTPDALENILVCITSMMNRGQKLITVIGCGGDRDTEKRPLMARIACAHSEKVILTSDNPRTEDPKSILSDMEKGVPEGKLPGVLIIEDRKQAIKTASAIAVSGDIILVAGKGHENYQEINGVKSPFDDKEVLKEVLLIL